MIFRAPKSPNDIPRGVSPHLYVHLPFCSQICPHCPYAKTPYRVDQHERYGAALLSELRGYLARTDRGPVRSLYFGGGTPTATPDLVERVIAEVRPHLEGAAEIGVEVHPADASRQMLHRLKAAGVTRVSLGIETFRDDLLKMLARRYTAQQVEASIREAKETGFECVDVNLIFGIPGQTETETAADAQRCIELGVDQISAYQLFTFVHTPMGKQVRHGDFDVYSDRARLRAQSLLAKTCLDAGLQRTSPWNFTRLGTAPYSTVTHEDYVGFGAGAGSKVGGVFWFNTFSVEAYIDAAPPRPALVMQTSERFRRAHWLYWRLYRTEVSNAEYAGLFGSELEDEFGTLLTVLRLTGMISRHGDIWKVTERGAVWMHRLQQLFSITYIDDIWERCHQDAWPQEVVLA